MNPLQQRLSALRRRLRLVVSFRGTCQLLGGLIGCVVMVGALDWLNPLPVLVRACLLVYILGFTAYVAYRFLYVPLCTKTDDLSLALRVEGRYPELNDALASAVQFLERPAVDQVGDSPGLRREAVQQAVRQAQGCDFNRAIDARGVRRASVAFLAGAALAAYLLLWHPAVAWTALARLADPFGEHDWPRQTQLTVDFRERVPAGEPFEIRGSLRGEIPARATIEFEGMPSSPQDYAVEPTDDGSGAFIARLDMTRQQGSFRFRVRANDAVSPPRPGAWHRVTVVQPPELTTFQVRLRYPAYTDLPPEDVQSGYDSMSVVLGTQVLIQGTTDRPVARVWVEKEMARPLAVAASLGAQSSLESLALGASRNSVWNYLPASLSPDGKSFHIKMVPGASGAYDLRWQDDQGVGLRRSFQIAVKNDPPPEVKLECLSLGGKATAVTPSAFITLRTLATDEEYALKSAFLEYRRKGKDGTYLDDWQRVPLYDYRAAGKAAPRLVLSGLSGVPASGAVTPFRLRAKAVELTSRMSLKGLVEEGNTLMLRAGADDFDDVTPGKAPGLSNPPLEILIVGSDKLKPLIEEAIREVRDELVRLNETQKNALELVREAERQLRDTGVLRPEDVKRLMDARTEQKKIEERVGKDRQEGLQKDVDRVRRMLEDNLLKRSPLKDKMDNVAEALERLAKDRLAQVQDQLEEARRAAEEAGQKPEKERAREVADARQSQEEVQKTLEGLLDDLVPFVTIQEMQGKARKLRDEQEKLLRETEEQEKRFRKRDELPNEGKRKRELDLENTARKQLRLAEETRKLLENLREIAQEREQDDPQLSKMLENAAERGNRKEVVKDMRSAAGDLKPEKKPSGEEDDPKFSEAKRKQRESKNTLDEVAAAMDEKREDELDRLSKKQQDEMDRLDEIKKEMDELKKTVRDIKQNVKDPGQRRRELQKLAGKQKELQAKVDRMVRRLSRLRAQEAVQEMRRLSRRMEEAARRLEDGEDPEQQQQEALNRINDAAQKLEKANNRVENELAREKLAKKTDEIKRMKDRQDAAIAESARIHKELREKGRWDELRDSLVRLKNDRQKALAEDAAKLAKDLERAHVFAHILQKTAQAMQKAVARMEERKQKVVDERTGRDLTKAELEDEDKADAETQKCQKEASRRLQRLLDALKQDGGGPPPAAADKQDQPGGEGGEGGQQGGDQGGGPPPPNQDGIPTLAEQKALRAEQQEVNERTQDFDKRHPELEKLTDEEKLQKLNAADKMELQEIHMDQKKVRELAQKLFIAAKQEEMGAGDKP
jgi:hypothetical protein